METSNILDSPCNFGRHEAGSGMARPFHEHGRSKYNRIRPFGGSEGQVLGRDGIAVEGIENHMQILDSPDKDRQ